MRKKSILREKSFQLSVLVVSLCRKLQEQKKRTASYSQFYRSGTAIAALIYEAEFAQSKADFINKLSIALKEANECLYWLNLMRTTGEIDDLLSIPPCELANEIIRMLVASIRTAKRNL